MSYRLTDIIATLENLGETEVPEVSSNEIESQELTTQVTDDATEINAQENAIESNDQTLADAEIAQDKISELTTIAEDSLNEDEGLSANETTIMEITHESIMRNLGLTHNTISYTAESFKDVDSRRVVTLEAISNLKESAKKIGDGIISALKVALNTVVNFLVGLLKNRTFMEKHLNNLMAKVKSVAGKQKARESFEKSASALSVEGKADVNTAIVILKDSLKLIKISEMASGQLNSDPSKLADIAQQWTDNYRMTNGRTMTVSSDENGVKFDVATGETAKEIPAPDHNQMTQLLTEALNVIKALKSFEATQSKLKSAVNSIINKLQSAANAIRSKLPGAQKEETSAPDASKENDNDAKKSARMTRAALSKIGGAFPTAAFNAVKATADYVTAGINNYKAPSETPSPTAAPGQQQLPA